MKAMIATEEGFLLKISKTWFAGYILFFGKWIEGEKRRKVNWKQEEERNIY